MVLLDSHFLWRRYWFRYLCRAIAAGVIVAATAYVSLPYWLPTNWIRVQLAKRVSAQIGCRVEIDSLGVSWSDGWDLRGVRIFSSGEAASLAGPPSPMISIERVRADFSPLTLLISRRIEWAKAISPEVDVKIDSAGEVNISPMSKLDFGVTIGLVSIHDAKVSFSSPQMPEPIVAHIHNAQLLENQLGKLGEITLSGGLVQDDSLAGITLCATFFSGAF